MRRRGIEIENFFDNDFAVQADSANKKGKKSNGNMGNGNMSNGKKANGNKKGNGNKKAIGNKKGGKSGVRLSILQTITGSPGTKFGRKLVTTRPLSDGSRKLLVASKSEVSMYALTNGSLTPPVPSTLPPTFTSPITNLVAYKKWIAVSSATNNEGKGIVYLYNTDNLTDQYPPIRGIKPGDYFGKGLAIMENEDGKPMVAVGGNGRVSTYILEIGNTTSSPTWVPVGGCLFPENATTNITGDGFGSSVDFGKDQSNNTLLFVSAPTHDKNKRKKKVGRIAVYRLENGVWLYLAQREGAFRNGRLGHSIKALDSTILVSAPLYKVFKGAVTHYFLNKGDNLARLGKLMKPPDKKQALFGTALDLWKIQSKYYIGVGGRKEEGNGLVQILTKQGKKKATKIASYEEDNKEETCGVGNSLVLAPGEGDMPGVIAGAACCDKLYVLGSK